MLCEVLLLTHVLTYSAIPNFDAGLGDLSIKIPKMHNTTIERIHHVYFVCSYKWWIKKVINLRWLGNEWTTSRYWMSINWHIYDLLIPISEPSRPSFPYSDLAVPSPFLHNELSPCALVMRRMAVTFITNDALWNLRGMVNLGIQYSGTSLKDPASLVSNKSDLLKHGAYLWLILQYFNGWLFCHIKGSE